MEDFNVILPSERFSFTGNSQENKIGLSSQSEPMDWLHKIMHSEPYNKEFNPKYITYIRIILLWRLALSFPPKVFLLSPEYLKANTHKRFCSWSILQGHTPGAKLLRVYQPFHRYTSSLGAEFPPNIWKQAPWANWANLKMLPRVYLTWSKLPQYDPSCALAVQNEPGACLGSKTLVCIGLNPLTLISKLRFSFTVPILFPYK